VGQVIRSRQEPSPVYVSKSNAVGLALSLREVRGSVGICCRASPPYLKSKRCSRCHRGGLVERRPQFCGGNPHRRSHTLPFDVHVTCRHLQLINHGTMVNSSLLKDLATDDHARLQLPRERPFGDGSFLMVIAFVGCDAALAPTKWSTSEVRMTVVPTVYSWSR
jgi:hypothetical protein